MNICRFQFLHGWVEINTDAVIMQSSIPAFVSGLFHIVILAPGELWPWMKIKWKGFLLSVCLFLWSYEKVAKHRSDICWAQKGHCNDTRDTKFRPSINSKYLSYMLEVFVRTSTTFCNWPLDGRKAFSIFLCCHLVVGPFPEDTIHIQTNK